ncbi:MAG: hypothetical protein RLZZ241_1503 [Bacteroidota bacterium]
MHIEVKNIFRKSKIRPMIAHIFLDQEHPKVVLEQVFSFKMTYLHPHNGKPW